MEHLTSKEGKTFHQVTNPVLKKKKKRIISTQARAST